MRQDIIEIGRQCLADEAQALNELIPQLDENFEKAVEMMFQCQGKVILTGVGKSGHIGQKIAATMSSTGTPAFFVNPLDAFHGDLGSISRQDVVLAISNSGNTDELLRIIPVLLQMQVPIIGMAKDDKSLLAKYSDVFLTVRVSKEACPLNLAPTSSTTAQLAMGDALAIALMKARDFQRMDFAQFHPGGQLGRQLLTTAADVMIKDSLPIVSEDMTLGEAIIHVSKGKIGLAMTTDQDNRITGLITDGDIRRAMERWQEKFFNRKVEDILTRNPQTVTADTKITTVLNIMHDKKVNMLPVTDKQNHLLGVVAHYSCTI